MEEVALVVCTFVQRCVIMDGADLKSSKAPSLLLPASSRNESKKRMAKRAFFASLHYLYLVRMRSKSERVCALWDDSTTLSQSVVPPSFSHSLRRSAVCMADHGRKEETEEEEKKARSSQPEEKKNGGRRRKHRKSLSGAGRQAGKRRQKAPPYYHSRRKYSESRYKSRFRNNIHQEDASLNYTLE